MIYIKRWIEYYDGIFSADEKKDDNNNNINKTTIFHVSAGLKTNTSLRYINFTFLNFKICIYSFISSMALPR